MKFTGRHPVMVPILFNINTTQASYNNTGLTTNSTYYYKVRAFRMVDSVKVYSGYSATISSKPIPEIPYSSKSSHHLHIIALMLIGVQ